MEHCSYSLRHLIDSIKYFTDSQIRDMIRDVVSGLKALHSKNVVHLDIKPENILFSKSNKFKIADLGLSRMSIRVKGEDIIEGDSRYLAPELLNDIHENSCPDLTKADIFSLGLTFYEVITGISLPPNGEEWHEVRSLKLTHFESNRHSEHLKNLVKSMLNPLPQMRPSAEELLNSGFLESEREGQFRWLKVENEILRKKIVELEAGAQIKRKNSF